MCTAMSRSISPRPATPWRVWRRCPTPRCFETREQLCAAVLERKHGLSTRFEALVSSLEHERADRQRGPSLSWKRLKDNVRDLKMGVMRRVVDSPLFEWWNDRKKASNAQRGAND
jgi:hypothetical protein